MATKTLLRTISGIDDVRAALNNSTMRRLLSIGTDWTKVRVGIRFSVADTGADLGSTPFFAARIAMQERYLPYLPTDLHSWVQSGHRFLENHSNTAAPKGRHGMVRGT